MMSSMKMQLVAVAVILVSIFVTSSNGAQFYTTPKIHPGSYILLLLLRDNNIISTRSLLLRIGAFISLLFLLSHIVRASQKSRYLERSDQVSRWRFLSTDDVVFEVLLTRTQ